MLSLVSLSLEDSMQRLTRINILFLLGVGIVSLSLSLVPEELEDTVFLRTSFRFLVAGLAFDISSSGSLGRLELYSVKISWSTTKSSSSYSSPDPY
jgi:hypothetical protein